MDIGKYLERIGAGAADIGPDLRSLKFLQRQHLLNVPFENLDIHWGRPIVIDTNSFYRKIVGEKRGGFCYELNGLFDQLLRELGFRTRLLSARVFNGEGHGPEFDHVTIVAAVGDDEYLVDVGFGDFSAEPMRFEPGAEHIDSAGKCIIRRFDDEYLETAKFRNGEWVSEFIFRDTARELAEFAAMCDFQQYAPESHFRKGKLCSVLTDTGRKTLTDSKLVITEGDERREMLVGSDEEFAGILLREFGISQPQTRRQKV